MSDERTSAAVAHDWAPGAHLVSPRRGYLHHGIYAGNGRVIHYAGLCRAGDVLRLRYGPVEEVSVARFAQGQGVREIPEPAARFAPEAVVDRARSRLGENRYRLLSNNCEHFVSWCFRDEHRSIQVEVFLLARKVQRRSRDTASAAA